MNVYKYWPSIYDVSFILQHFHGGHGPTDEYPDPLPAANPDVTPKACRPPPKKRRVLQSDENLPIQTQNQLDPEGILIV